LSELPASYFAMVPTYDADVAPILERYCVSCHTADGLMAGGVELNTYQSAFSARVKNVCTAITPAVVDRFGSSLRSPRHEVSDLPCADWDTYSMPKGAKLKLTLYEQLVLARWVETGASER